MIKRVNDLTVFPESTLEKLAKVVDEQENIKLIDVVDNREKVALIQKQLKIQGYQSKVELHGDKFKVYAITPEKVNFDEAVESGAFKKLAWGRYCFQREGALGMFKYDFDDGTIWRVMTGEDGTEYLVKEVDDEKDDEIVRVKTAGIDSILVNDQNVKTVIGILYDNLDNNQFVKDLLESDIKSQIYSILNTKLANLIDTQIEKNHFVRSPEYTADIKSIVKTAIDNSKLTNKEQLHGLIKEYTDTLINTTGKMQKLFN